MTKSLKLLYYFDSLSVYDFSKDGVMAALREMLCCTGSADIIAKTARFFSKVSAVKSLGKHIAELVLQNDNVFSRAAAQGRESELGAQVLLAVSHDLAQLEEISSVSIEDIIASVEDKDVRAVLRSMPAWAVGGKEFPFSARGSERLHALAAFHKEHGFGIFVRHNAFSFKGGQLIPITSTDPVRLTDLKNYDAEREKVLLNTQHFLKGLPANNVLLYGDRGTGKSSTVHALLNEFAPAGLRMVEISKAEIPNMARLGAQIAGNPMKFIVFIDDLSFDSRDDSFGELKAVLEGSLSGRGSNMLIYATSNRRHLIKENFTDRENEVNRNDVLQEQLSLSDRFGLVITFINPDKKGYLDIVEKIAADRGLNVDKEKLFAAAERWAARKGGRSPRCAKQFVDYTESAEKSKTAW
ncbi:MAG: ATP-binding protein [Clostridiales bacterium]|nr:ATP-binding protein [Clostridiales bacterium]